MSPSRLRYGPGVSLGRVVSDADAPCVEVMRTPLSPRFVALLGDLCAILAGSPGQLEATLYVLDAER
ncbi:hypothetical protein PSCLAVI8L_90020 [Pseudoclavibacter sp. 8L]|nr:hypothetical protein PSCLAVI8L_90020 [Pseudoclavibacter sp. 8L]